MHKAMVREGRTGIQMAYSERDYEYLVRNGWKPADFVPSQPEPVAEEKRKPGRPKLTLKGKP